MNEWQIDDQLCGNRMEPIEKSLSVFRSCNLGCSPWNVFPLQVGFVRESRKGIRLLGRFQPNEQRTLVHSRNSHQKQLVQCGCNPGGVWVRHHHPRFKRATRVWRTQSYSEHVSGKSHCCVAGTHRSRIKPHKRKRAVVHVRTYLIHEGSEQTLLFPAPFSVRLFMYVFTQSSPGDSLFCFQL